MKFQRGRVYLLTMPDRFDDEFGRGYDRAELVGAGPVPEDCWVHDAWIVDAKGRRHPGLNVSPVPVRLRDLVENVPR